MFKTGEKVICVNSTNTTYLTKGGIYEVVDTIKCCTHKSCVYDCTEKTNLNIHVNSYGIVVSRNDYPYIKIYNVGYTSHDWNNFAFSEYKGPMLNQTMKRFAREYKLKRILNV